MTLHNIKQLKRDNGFTIIELLIVIIVIGILATLVLVGYNNIQGQANDTKRQADAGSLRDAAASFKIAGTNGVYPTATPSGFQTDVSTGSNYQSGTSPINIDSGVTGKIVTGALTSVGPKAGTTDVYNVAYCGTNTSNLTATTASGMKISYWRGSDSSVQTVVTGSNTTGVATASAAGCAI